MKEVVRLEIVLKKTSELIPYINNTRTHDEKQIKQIAASIKEFGFNNWRFCNCNENYVVTECGNVLRVCRVQFSKAGNLIKKYETNILKGSIDKYGYKTVKMLVDGKKKHIKVHRIVATAFLINQEYKPQVNHKNMNKLDNRIVNLEWCTDLENKKHFNMKVGNKWNI